MLEIGFSRFTQNLLQRTYRLVAPDGRLAHHFNGHSSSEPGLASCPLSLSLCISQTTPLSCSVDLHHRAEFVPIGIIFTTVMSKPSSSTFLDIQTDQFAFLVEFYTNVLANQPNLYQQLIAYEYYISDDDVAKQILTA